MLSIISMGNGKMKYWKKKSDKAKAKQPSPRKQVYEAKFDMYLQNKYYQERVEKKQKSQKKEDFDLYTKGKDSPSKKADKLRKSYNPIIHKSPPQIDKDDLEELAREDDKMRE